ncbi:MAG: hypothetical protein RL077_1541 [Verrucomicrobiota bacterium]|jgi:TonB-dependent receptor
MTSIPPSRSISAATGLRRRIILLTSTALAFIAGSTSAQTPSTGTIEGRVQNEVTGRYLGNSRIVVKGSDLRVLTDESGSYRLTDVPGGPVVIEVFYTGLDLQEIALKVPAGQTVTRNISLTNRALYGESGKGGVVKLDPFTVGAAKVTDQASIAINEQRFAPNIKNIVAVGDISEQPDGNIGEFLKMLPGVSTAGSGSVPASIYIRGFPPNTTTFTVDGATIASTGFGAPDRTVQTSNQTPGTGISRLEVTKVPTPATAADTMAGSVNMVTRTAFEADRASFAYQVNLAGVLSEISLKKEPTGWERDLVLVKPGYGFVYTKPVNKDFGFVVSASASDRQRPGETITPVNNVNSATYGSSPSKPMFQSYVYGSNSAIFSLANAALKVDWRVGPNSVLSSSFETYHWRGISEGFSFTRSAGIDATPTVAVADGGVAGSFGPDSTIGATGRGGLTYSTSFNTNNKGGLRGSLRYTYSAKDWHITLQGGYAKARYWLTDESGVGIGNRTFANFGTSVNIPIRVELRNIDPVKGPGSIKVFNNNNQELNVYDRSILAATNITGAAFAEPRYSADLINDEKVDIKRKLSFLSFPASVQIGGLRRERKYSYTNAPSNWTYQGPNGNQSALPYVITRKFKEGEPEGKVVPLVSPVLAYRAWQQNPALFFQTPAQQTTALVAKLSSSEHIREQAEALYFQVEGRFFNSRLNVLTGLRYERTISQGQGSLNTPDAVWQRNANGTYVLSADGARTRKAEAGAAGSLAEARLLWTELGAKSARSYGDLYPSLHLTYNITDQLLTRAAFAQTYGRPNFSFVVPKTVVSERTDSQGDSTGGQLTVRNPGLKPWTANNYDLTLEYYTNQGGVFGVGVFRKEVKNFFSSVVSPARESDLIEAGLDPKTTDLAGWTLATTVNSEAAEVNGYEINMSQSLLTLDRWTFGWGRNFHVFANVTKLKMSGPGAASLNGFLPLGVNGGVRFNKKPLMVSVNFAYRDSEVSARPTNFGPNGETYIPARTHTDLALGINLRRNLDFFFNVRNLFDVRGRSEKRSDVLPTYARSNGTSDTGAVFSAGIKGSF